MDIYTSAQVTGTSLQLAAHKHKCTRTVYARWTLLFMEDPILIMASVCLFCWSIQTGKPSLEESICHLCVMFAAAVSIKHSRVVSICEKLQNESFPLFLRSLRVDDRLNDRFLLLAIEGNNIWFYRTKYLAHAIHTIWIYKSNFGLKNLAYTGMHYGRIVSDVSLSLSVCGEPYLCWG